jgi:hypothetical protein
MKKFSKILESNYNDIQDMFLYIEDYIYDSALEIMYENIKFKILNLIFLKEIDFNGVSTVEFKENIDKATAILEIMERIKKATNKEPIFSSHDGVYDATLIEIIFDPEASFNKFLNTCAPKFNRYDDFYEFNFNQYSLPSKISINKDDASAILEIKNESRKHGKELLNNLIKYLSDYNIEFVEQNDDYFTFKVNTVIFKT